ncbi:hypothetical protein [Anaerosphaera multitolerans]|uniref:Polyketide cyclase n=1 Tax=Anaerosphaera multitolerans TaxID=2487351 RepID=A0A437SA33_9FIRM|nr:hypothetical protein [Anaerosphaera multitolerans]RVU55852.1 hypothetical protein EF514_01170 [Anaerosphaera multitolerans]
MFEYSNKISSEVSVEKVWLNYKDVDNWAKWDSSIEHIELSGTFKKGTTGILKNFGMAPLEFVLTEVLEKESFSNKSELGPFSVVFTHTIVVEKNMVTIEHGVNVDGPDKNKVQEIGNLIASSIPDAMNKLLEISK